MNDFVKKDRVEDWDRERRSFFHILWGCPELRARVDTLYSFEDRSMTGEMPEMSSSAKALLSLARALFNGYPADIYQTFHALGEEYTKLAMEALEMRFG